MTIPINKKCFFWQECNHPRVRVYSSSATDTKSDAKQHGDGGHQEGPRHDRLLPLRPGDLRHRQDQEVPHDTDQLQRGNLGQRRSRSQEKRDQFVVWKHFGSGVSTTASTNHHVSGQTFCSSFSSIQCSATSR